MKSQSTSLLNIAFAAFRADPSLGELQAKPIFNKIRTYLKSGMNEDEAVTEVIKDNRSYALAHSTDLLIF